MTKKTLDLESWKNILKCLFYCYLSVCVCWSWRYTFVSHLMWVLETNPESSMRPNLIAFNH